MIKNVLYTTASKFLIALISFLLLIINANVLGAEGLGTIGLIVLSIVIILLISNLIHTSIVYFSSRHANGSLLIISYFWSLIGLGLIMLIQETFHPFPLQYQNEIYGLAFLQSLIVIHQNILIGKEKIKKFNIMASLQAILSLLSLCFFYFVRNQQEVESFIMSLFLAYTITFIYGFFSTIKLLTFNSRVSYWDVFKDAFNYGFFVQSANIFQLLNLRLSYYILDAFAGRASLGLYSAGVQLSEALLLPAKSMSTIQYARISARKEEKYAQRITLLFMKVSVLLTCVGLVVLLILPTSVYQFILGAEFHQVKWTILAMSIGILALSAENILSHYFSGTGRQHKNSASSLIGLILTLIFAFILIPKYGEIGAGISSSIAFSGMLIFLIINMKKHPGMKLDLFKIKKDDLQLLKKLLASIFT